MAGLDRELQHLAHATCYIWQVVRVSSAETEAQLRVETIWLQDELNYQLRNHSYKVKSKSEDRKIYLKKEWS